MKIAIASDHAGFLYKEKIILPLPYNTNKNHMPTLKKNTRRKPSNKAKQPKTAIKFKRVPLEEVKLPAKFAKMDEMLKRTTFLP